MAETTKGEWHGFLPKLALGAFGIMFTMLVGYFVWLGTAVVEVRAKVTNIEASVASLNRSVADLNQTRREQADAKSESNSARIGALEEEGTNE